MTTLNMNTLNMNTSTMYSTNDTRDFSKPKQRMSKPFCKVCFQAGCSPEQYNSHYVRANPASTSKVVCPTLLKLKCNYCKKNGHTISHCSVLADKKGFSSPDELKTHVIQERSKRVEVDLFQNMSQTEVEETIRNEEMMDDIERMMREDDIHIFRAQNPHLYIPYDTYYNTYNTQPIYYYPLYRQDYDQDYGSVPNDLYHNPLYLQSDYQPGYQPIMFYTQQEQDYYQGAHMKRRRLELEFDNEVDNEVDDTGSIS